jgi:hypothetical protein
MSELLNLNVQGKNLRAITWSVNAAMFFTYDVKRGSVLRKGLLTCKKGLRGKAAHILLSDGGGCFLHETGTKAFCKILVAVRSDQ